jgi:hypothetical protein
MKKCTGINKIVEKEKLSKLGTGFIHSGNDSERGYHV